MKKILYATMLGALAGCVPANPVVSSFNGDSVKIQISEFVKLDEARAATQIEADRICAKRSRRAEFASTRTIADYTSEHLYLCL